MNMKSSECNFMGKALLKEAWEKLSGDFTWTEKLLEKYSDRVDWKRVSGNYRIAWTVSMLDKFKNRIDWHELSGVRSETLLTMENLKRYETLWDWEELSHNDSLNWSFTLIDCFIDRWHWVYLIHDYTLDKSMLNSKFFNKYQDYISAEELEDSNLWENMVQEEKRKLMVRIVSEA